MIVLHATFPIREEKLDEALALIDDLVDASNEEDGMLDYRAAQDVQDRTVIRFFEQYEDDAAFESHTRTDHFQEFEGVLGDLLAGEPEVVKFDVSTATELEL